MFLPNSMFSLSLPSLRIGFRHAPLGLDRMRLGTASELAEKHDGRSLHPRSVATKPPLSKGGLEGLSIYFF